jgi:hypothetical protein
MAQVLGDAWTEDVHEAWTAASRALTSIMRRSVGTAERAA